MGEFGAKPALPVNLLDRKLLLQREGVIHALTYALLEYILCQAREGCGICSCHVTVLFAECAAMFFEGRHQGILDGFRVVVVDFLATNTGCAPISAARHLP